MVNLVHTDVADILCNIDSILRVQEEILGRLRDLIRRTIASLSENKLCREGSHDSWYCCTYMLGRLMKALCRHGFGSTWIPTRKVGTSIRNLAYQLSKFPFKVNTKGYVTPCDLGTMILPEINSILLQSSSAVLDHHKRHIEDQAKKSGVEDLKFPSPKKDQAF
jgi:hypothetical protein